MKLSPPELSVSGFLASRVCSPHSTYVQLRICVLLLQVVVADAATMRLPTESSMSTASAQLFSADMPTRIPLVRWDCDAACVIQLGAKAAAQFAGIMAGEQMSCHVMLSGL